MSKAEELSQNRYPTWAEKYAFIDGYEQAEKDLKLSWKDIEQILDIINNIIGENFNANDYGVPADKEFYQEVLKRYKEMKVE